jgi:hypothetical protein
MTVEYGVYCREEERWCVSDDGIVFHTDHLGVAIAQRDVCHIRTRGTGWEWRVRQFPDVEQFDHAENIATIPMHSPKAGEANTLSKDSPGIIAGQEWPAHWLDGSPASNVQEWRG